MSVKSFTKSLVQKFKLKALNIAEKNNVHVVENEDSDDDDDDDISDADESGDEFSKIFDSIKTEDKKKDRKKKISQIISIVSNDNQKILTTPGEWGSHLIKIEITDTRDLKGVPKDEHWKKVGQKAVFLIKTSEDENYKKIIKILQSVGKNIASTSNVKKITKKL